MDPLTDLETAVLRQIAKQYPNAGPELEEVLRSCLVSSRRNTGNGFFIHLAPDRERYPPLRLPSPLGEAWISVKGMERGLGCMVFLKEGYPTLLEGYALAGGDTSQIDFGSACFTIHDTPPHWE